MECDAIDLVRGPASHKGLAFVSLDTTSPLPPQAMFKLLKKDSAPFSLHQVGAFWCRLPYPCPGERTERPLWGRGDRV